VPTLNHHFYAFESMTGNRLWDTFLDGKLDKPVLPIGKMVYVPSTGAGVYALATSDGAIKWHNMGITRVLAASNDRVYAVDNAKHLAILNPDTGAIDRTIVVPHAKFFLTSTTGILYILTTDGRLGAIESDTQP
jgi:outer membrane protein assembly factor BamB